MGFGLHADRAVVTSLRQLTVRNSEFYRRNGLHYDFHVAWITFLVPCYMQEVISVKDKDDRVRESEVLLLPEKSLC